jgi:hypothetical protein
VQLEGSCHCGGVRFTVRAPHPRPYMHCYCSICRKTAGGGGYAINLGTDAATLQVQGREHVRVYHARIQNPGDARAEVSPGERHFCGTCGSALWVFDPRWPGLVHPFASAVDTPLPKAPSRTHIMLDFRAPWVPLHLGPGDAQFPRYPEESLAAWHRRQGLEEQD